MKNILSILIITCLSAQLSFAKVINVADHGIVPGKDMSLKVNMLIESLKGQKDLTLFFPKGQYEFYPENALDVYRAVTNHDNSLKRLVFPLFGTEGWTLDGNGSTFMFHGRICPITVFQSKGTNLKNFSIDWETPFHHELRVIENDPKTNSFVAEITPKKYGYEIKSGELLFNHYDWQDRFGQNITFDPKTEAPIWNTRLYSLRVRHNTVVKDLGNGKVSLKNITQQVPPVGSIMSTYGNAPTNRLAQAIHLDQSTDTYIENVTVYAAGGMALIAERCDNVKLNKFVVTSTDKRHMATRADATHFLGCKGVIQLENCLLEHMLDDGINVHGAYIKVEKYMGEKTFLCEISHRQQTGLVFAEKGDKVMITSRETILPVFETTVTDAKIINERRLLVTVSEIPEVMPEGLLSLENITWNPDVILRNNIIRDNRARSGLITTKGSVLIENNYFSSQMHGILIEGDNNSWYESGGVRDIIIKNNTFVNIGYGSGTHYPLCIAPLLRPEQRLGDEKYHQNIQLINNTFKSFNGLLVHAMSVKGLTISGNTIELDDKYPTGSDLPSISLDYCEDVTIKKNKYIGFDWPIRVEKKENSTNVVIEKNKGLKNNQALAGRHPIIR